NAEMGPHEIKGGKVADALIKLRRAAQIGEKKSEAGDLQSLIDVDRVCPIDVAERLVGKQALRRQEGSAIVQQRMKRVVGKAYGWKGAHLRSVLDGKTQRSGPEVQHIAVSLHAVEDEGKVLPLPGRLALHIDELRSMRDRLEDDGELCRKLQ